MCQSVLKSGASNMWVTRCFLLTFGLGLTQGLVRLDPLVDTPKGLIRGLRADDGDYSMFLGVPYGQVNESNPFGASLPQPKFEQVFEAYDDSAVCPQVEEFGNTIVGTLDCLHLNIFVPNKASFTNRLPVLVWIYGGGFTIGFHNRFLYGPKYLVRHDVILVTLNYRLGPYGFMCLDTPEVPGNQGLKDQLLALRWIKENIASFGGDVNKITIMGESAGAASVEYHVISKQERLFNQAIMQSGSVLSPWGVVDSDSTPPLKIAARLGFETEDVSEALAFLTNVDTKLVIGASSDLGLRYRVCIEQEFEDVESILADYPINLDYPKVKNIPILAGFNNRERMTSFVNQNADYFKNLDAFGTLQTAFNFDEDSQNQIDKVRRFYIGDEEINQDVRFAIENFNSDFDFNYPVQRSMQKYLDNGAVNVYQYLFSYSGERNFVKKRMNITEWGAAHADEIAYLFDLSYDKSPSDEDQQVIDQMTTLWTNFVKYGEPTPEVTELLPVKWIPITKDTYNYLNIGSELKMKKRVFHSRMTFWEVFYELNEFYLKGKRNPFMY